LTTAGPAAGQEDAGARALQQNQLQRQQQQEQLQLRLQQYQRGAQNPARDARQRQAVEQLEMDQSRRQQQLHQQQQRDLQTRPDLPFEDPGTRDAKAQIEQQRAARESRQQLQQFDRELQQQGEAAGAGSERRPLPAVPRQGSGGLTPPP
jgi:hypothetical protein